MRIISLIVLASLIIVNTTFAGDSNYNTSLGSKTLSLNGLYFAGSDGIANIITNPASLTDLNYNTIEFFLIDNLEKQKFSSEERGNFISYRHDVINLGIGANFRIADNAVVALSYQTPFDLNVDWPFTTIREKEDQTAVMAFELNNKIKIDAVSAAYSMKLNDLSVGITANLYFANNIMNFYQTNYLWEDTLGLPSYQVTYDQNAMSFGIVLGAGYKLSESIDLAAVITSGSSFSLEGKAQSNMLKDLYEAPAEVDIKSNFEIPWSIGIGCLWKISDELNLNIDAKYSLWSQTQRTMEINFEDDTWEREFSQIDTLSGYNPSEFILEFNNTLDAGIGLEYYNPAGVSFRCGYRFSQTPNSDATYNHLFPTVGTHWLSAGIGFSHENVMIDMSVIFSIGNETIIPVDSNPWYSGTYDSEGYYPSINIKYNL